jgi:GTPase SAR1 family protein
MGVVRRVLRGSERDAISFAFGHSCAGCRKLLQPGWHADHIIALADGGPDEPQNMQPLCAPCHTLKTARENSSRAAAKRPPAPPAPGAPTAHVAPTAPTVLIGLMGLPSAGKSSMVNALLGMRVRQSGVCRTTKDVFLVGTEARNKELRLSSLLHAKHELTSDDGVRYDLLDFPGVADAEETNSHFFDACVTWGLKCDVICWVSDIRTSFMTVHEKAEFERLREVLQEASVQTGRFYQYCIVLTKYDFDDTTTAREPVRVERGEIADPEEETTVTDCLARVRRLFPDTRICKFNAFGRIAHRGSSEALRALLARMAPPRNVNTEFELQWAVESLPQRRQWHMLDSLFKVRFSHGANYVKQDIKILTDPEVLRELFERIVLSCSPRTCIAHQVGIVPALAHVAALVEPDIPVNPDSLACLLALLGPNDPVYTRAYIRLFKEPSKSYTGWVATTFKSTRTCIVAETCACRSYEFVAPAGLTELADFHPAVFQLDVEAAAISACSAAYGRRLTEARAALWGPSADGADGACWRMLVTASWLGKVSSVLAPIE